MKPQYEPSLERLKSAVALLEQQAVQGRDESRNTRLEQQVAALLQENAALAEKLKQLEQRYETLHTAGREVEGQLGSAIHALELLVEKPE